MAIWRDPIDELICELERSLTPDVASAKRNVCPPLADIQFAVHEYLKGEQAWARAEKDPRVQAVLAHFDRLGQLREAASERSEKG